MESVNVLFYNYLFEVCHIYYCNQKENIYITRCKMLRIYGKSVFELQKE